MPAAEQPFSDDELTSLFQPAAQTASLALAVSGGSDSAALLLLAARWTRLLSSPPRVTVLTVDHGLRPEAAEEARAVARWAAAEGFGHKMLRWHGPKPPLSGLQAAARAARYGLMADWCRGNEAAMLLTAHTQDDQAETVIMRLARGTGIEGLAGIARQIEWAGIAVLRPLLGQSRARLRGALKAADRLWFDDRSNRDECFERVRIRKAMPQLAAIGLTPQALSRTAKRAFEAWQALAAQAEDFLSAASRHHEMGYGEVDLQRLAALPRDIRVRVLARLIERYGGERGEPLQLSGIERLADLEGWKQPARTFGGCKLARRSLSLLAGREFGRIDPTPCRVPDCGRLLWDGRFLIAAPPGNRVVPLGILSQVKRVPGLPRFVQNSLPAVLDDTGAPAVPHLDSVPCVSVMFVAARTR